jgi:hypothetical protein
MSPANQRAAFYGEDPKEMKPIGQKGETPVSPSSEAQFIHLKLHNPGP